MELLLLLSQLWIACGVVGGLIARSSGRGIGTGVLLGLFLGPLGWLVVVLDDGHYQCPVCREPVRRGAVACRFCRVKFSEPAK